MMRRRDWLGAVAVATTLAWGNDAAAQPAWDAYVESETYPIRVHYTDEVGIDTANTVVGYAETAWAQQVVGMGFPAPTAEDEEGNRHAGLWIYVNPDASYDTGQPVGDNPDTPRTDCTARAIVKTVTPDWYLPIVVSHETSHVLEFSADCGEAMFAYENTTNAVTTITDPDGTMYAQYFLPTFQKHPYHGFDCVFYTSQEKAYFHFGASLFQIFLEDRYGDYDGKLIASLWDAARQDGTVTSVSPYGEAEMSVANAPDLLEAMDVVLQGKATSLDAAFVEFARWRYFVGTRDDGLHFRHGADWSECELVVDRTLTLDELPLASAAPNDEPNAYGSSYLELDLSGLGPEQGVHFTFHGTPASTWNVDVMLVRANQTSDVVTVATNDEAVADVTLSELGDYVRAVFVLSSLGDGSHDADNPQCSTTFSFTYDLALEDLAPPPELTSVAPAQLERGTSPYVWVSGGSLVDGLSASFGDAGIEVGSVDFVDHTSFGMQLAVADDAALGPQALTVANPNGDEATLADAVEVVAPFGDSQDISGIRAAGGCICTAGRPTPARQALGWAALLPVALAWTRRRRPSGR